MLFSCNFLGNSQPKLEIGKIYTKPFIWDENNPFEKTQIDTIIIICIKGNYVQWALLKNKNNPDFYLSSELHYLRKAKLLK